jgi:hypothetical protein
LPMVEIDCLNPVLLLIGFIHPAGQFSSWKITDFIIVFVTKMFLLTGWQRPGAMLHSFRCYCRVTFNIDGSSLFSFE